MEKVKGLVGKGWQKVGNLEPEFVCAIRKSKVRFRLADKDKISVSLKQEGGEEYIKFEKIA